MTAFQGDLQKQYDSMEEKAAPPPPLIKKEVYIWQKNIQKLNNNFFPATC